MPTAKRPPPELFKLSTNAWTQPFWDAAANHTLVAARCAHCGHFRMPPTPFCPRCQSQRIDWPVLSGRGEVYSYTVVERAILPGMEPHLPYVPAIITLSAVMISTCMIWRYDTPPSMASNMKSGRDAATITRTLNRLASNRPKTRLFLSTADSADNA